jgi:hypothetical protein
MNPLSFCSWLSVDDEKLLLQFVFANLMYPKTARSGKMMAELFGDSHGALGTLDKFVELVEKFQHEVCLLSLCNLLVFEIFCLLGGRLWN